MSFPVETVTVRRYEKVSEDPYGAPVSEPEETPVDHVLVAPGARADLGEERPEGVEINFTLYFPKTYTESLEGAQVCVRGEWYHVIGHPDVYDASWCPTDWNRVVEVSATHG